jgi:hypothetical protein
MPAAEAVYRLALALWAGGMALFTFVVTPVVFRTRSRDDAAQVVASLFPPYFRYLLAVIVVALVARLVSRATLSGAKSGIGTALVVLALFLTGFQAFYLLPRMEAVKATVPSFGQASPQDPARRAFSRLHGVSMAFNLVVLAEGALLIAARRTFGG